MKYVIFDLDGTLSDARWRDHLKPDWDAWTEMAELDQPIWPMLHLASRLQMVGYRLIILTARSEKYQQMTERWLWKYGLDPLHLFMRRQADAGVPSGLLKPTIVTEFIEMLNLKKTDVAFIVDDRPEVCAAFQRLGYIALQVHGP